MATKTLSVLTRFPIGTSVSAYAVPHGHLGPGLGEAPSVAATETATVAADGSLTFSSLASDTDYVAGAQILGIWQYVRLSTRTTAAERQIATLTSTAQAARRHIRTYAITGTVGLVTLPGFFESVATGETKTLVRCRYGLSAGTATIKLQRRPSGGAWADITGFTALSVSTTPAQVAPTAVTLADNDEIRLVVTAATTASDLSVSVAIDSTR